MKIILLRTFGALVILGGAAFGLWLGVWVCFIGGIVQIVNACQAHPVAGMGIGLGLVRMACAALAGWGSFAICALVGSLCFLPSRPHGPRR